MLGQQVPVLHPLLASPARYTPLTRERRLPAGLIIESVETFRLAARRSLVLDWFPLLDIFIVHFRWSARLCSLLLFLPYQTLIFDEYIKQKGNACKRTTPNENSPTCVSIGVRDDVGICSREC